MKSKKIFLPTIIILAAIFAISIYCIVSGIAKKPTITEKEFPFSITYELNGETKTIKDVYTVRYNGNDGYADTKTRTYVGKIGDMDEGTTHYILQGGEGERIELLTNFYADYMMGDSDGDYFDEKPFAPQLLYYDSEEKEYSDIETLNEKGVKIISFEYPTPIENSFVFSHISVMSGEVVIPALIISILALIAVLLLVKKENIVRKSIDTVSLVMNFLIGIILLPYCTVCAVLLDALGGGDEILYKIFYFVPSIIVLGITASVALRRKEYSKGSVAVQLVGPAVFAIIIVVAAILEWL